jgi:hypothetical protein
LTDFHGGQVVKLWRRIEKGARSRSGDQFVVDQLLAQRVAIDAEDLGGQRLVAAGLFENDFEHRALDALDHHLVNGSRLLAVKPLKVVFQRLADASRDIVIVGIVILGSCGEVLKTGIARCRRSPAAVAT